MRTMMRQNGTHSPGGESADAAAADAARVGRSPGTNWTVGNPCRAAARAGDRPKRLGISD